MKNIAVSTLLMRIYDWPLQQCNEYSLPPSNLNCLKLFLARNALDFAIIEMCETRNPLSVLISLKRFNPSVDWSYFSDLQIGIFSVQKMPNISQILINGRNSIFVETYLILFDHPTKETTAKENNL